MGYASVDGLKIYYETFGEPQDIPVLLISGLGTQCVRWDDEFCQGLADRYFHVVRFDNRDVGMSSRVEGSEDVVAVMEAVAAGEPVDLAYTLSDMARDAIAVLDALELERAHVVGLSLGGMIAQVMAIDHRDRVSSLTSIMSTTGNPEFGAPTPEAVTALLEEVPIERDALIDHNVRIAHIWASPDYLNEAYMRDMAARQFDRAEALGLQGVGRQSCAALAAPSREEQLSQLDLPTLVIHGELDTLINVSGGHRTAEVVPEAELLVIENMSHDWPPELFGPIIEAITRHIISAGQR